MIETIADFIETRSRLNFTGHRRKALARAVEERARTLGSDDLSGYFRRLRASAAEERDLLELLTVNETSFFRNPAQFSFLAERIVPALGLPLAAARGIEPGAIFQRVRQ